MADETTTSTSDNKRSHDDPTGNGDDDRDENILVVATDPERFPHVVLRGASANLEALRGADAQTRAAFFEERWNPGVHDDGVDDNGDASSSSPSPLLLGPIAATVMVKESGARDVFGDDNDEALEHNNEEEDAQEPASANGEDNCPEAVKGEVAITHDQVLFVAEDRESVDADLAIGGACIVLHAMTEDPEPSVYLQLSSSEEFDGGGLSEVTLVPSNSDGDCQRLFDALCKIVALHPNMDDDDDEGDGFLGMGGMIGGGFGDDGMADYGEPGLIWAPTTASTGNTGAEATPEEREAMLERLDNLLVVAPGLEAGEGHDGGGQFDDAPEE